MKNKPTVEYDRTFIKGQVLFLDDIYSVQGLGGGDWWDGKDFEGDDNIIITRTIRIKVIVTSPKNKRLSMD